jgi:uncharacterized protein YbaR (Trm112 family)
VAARADKPAHPSEIDPAVLAQLACPACHGDLRLERSSVQCIACHRTYPIVDGIPALIIERAEPSGEEG